MELVKLIEECVVIVCELLESGKVLNILKKFVELNSWLYIWYFIIKCFI